MGPAPPGNGLAVKAVSATGIPRRVVLSGLLSAYTATLIPWALAETAPDVDRGNFLILSALIAGREALDNDLAMRYYEALVAVDASFPAAVTTVLTLINYHHIDPLRLQALARREGGWQAPVSGHALYRLRQGVGCRYRRHV